MIEPNIDILFYNVETTLSQSSRGQNMILQLK